MRANLELNHCLKLNKYRFDRLFNYEQHALLNTERQNIMLH